MGNDEGKEAAGPDEAGGLEKEVLRDRQAVCVVLLVGQNFLAEGQVAHAEIEVLFREVHRGEGPGMHVSRREQ
nr:hypothetical protein GCM10023233_31740 [Brevibacterium otitidis]